MDFDMKKINKGLAFGISFPLRVSFALFEGLINIAFLIGSISAFILLFKAYPTIALQIYDKAKPIFIGVGGIIILLIKLLISVAVSSFIINIVFLLQKNKKRKNESNKNKDGISKSRKRIK